MEDFPLSLCRYPGKPKIDDIALITVKEVRFGTGMAKGNLLYSSMIVKVYLLVLTDGKGPLKSILIRSKGCVALMDCET